MKHYLNECKNGLFTEQTPTNEIKVNTTFTAIKGRQYSELAYEWPMELEVDSCNHISKI